MVIRDLVLQTFNTLIVNSVTIKRKKGIRRLTSTENMREKNRFNLEMEQLNV